MGKHKSQGRMAERPRTGRNMFGELGLGHREDVSRPGPPPGAFTRPSRFPYADRFCTGRLHGRAGRLTAKQRRFPARGSADAADAAAAAEAEDTRDRLRCERGRIPSFPLLIHHTADRIKRGDF